LKILLFLEASSSKKQPVNLNAQKHDQKSKKPPLQEV